MLRVICFSLVATSFLAGSVCAQNVARPLDFGIPPSTGFPVAKTASIAPASNSPVSTAPASATVKSGVPMAAIAGIAAADPELATDSCDATTANKTQVHGSVDADVAAGNHVSGNYQSATVNITKPLGDCDHPDRTLSITAHVSQSRFAYRGRR